MGIPEAAMEYKISGETKVKNRLVMLMSLLFLSATSLVLAEDAAVQKEKAQDKVNVDQKNLDSSNKELSQDKDAIHEHNEKIKSGKKTMKHHAKKLAEHQAELKDAKKEDDE